MFITVYDVIYLRRLISHK